MKAIGDTMPRVPRLPAMRSAAFAVFLCIAPSTLFGQKTEPDVRARLVDKPLYLRGQWSGGKLAFDAVGHLRGTSTPVAFTLAGVQIGSVKLGSKSLVLKGQRVGLEFTEDLPKRVGLVWPNSFGATSPEEITMEIQTPSDGDFTTALDAILTSSLTGLNSPMPWCWQQYMREHPLLAKNLAMTEIIVPAAVSGEDTLLAESGIRKVGGIVSAPVVIKHVMPDVNRTPNAFWYSSALKYSCIASITFVVEKDGTPSHVRFLHALGLGLDELAVAAVSQYKFQPAIENGSAVPVQMTINITFSGNPTAY